MHLKCIGKPQEVSNLQLNENKGIFLDENFKKLINMEGCTI